MIAQLLLGGRIREIGLAIFAGAAALFCLIAPTFRTSSAVSPDLAGALVASFFTLLGLGMVVGSVPGARREIRLLRHGRLTPGHVVDVRARARAQRQRDFSQWLVAFEFEREDGTPYRCRVVAFEEPALGSAGTIVYDPRWPDHATSLDHLPGGVTIDDAGDVRRLAARPYGALLAVAGLGLLAAAIVRLLT